MRRTVLLIAVSATLLSCIEKDVRLYVKIDDSCIAACETQTFSVSLNGEEEKQVMAGRSVLIEQVLTTRALLGIALLDDPAAPGRKEKCERAVYKKVNSAVTALLKEGPSYLYFDSIYFEDKDLHVTLECSEAAGQCEGVSCWSPPENSCSEDGALVVHARNGVCSGGDCAYATRETSCKKNECDDGQCTLEPCAGVVCNTPPAPRCDGDGAVLQSAQNGTCSGGECRYATRSVACEGETCAAGSCESAVCHNVYCDSPPAQYCRDKETLRRFSPRGYCDGGSGEAECRYAYLDVNCPFGCTNGECDTDPCEGVSCTLPPAQYCDGDTLVIFNGNGRCEGGQCGYARQRRPCESECEDGRCVDTNLCADVVCDNPPAPYCKDAYRLRAFSKLGNCEGGVCDYEADETLCAAGCEEGKCLDDLCIGVICNAPPPAVCSGDSVITWDGTAGRCVEGGCTYATTAHTCARGCNDGACKGDECVGVLCKAAPADYCLDDRTVARFSPEGMCNADGACEYESEIGTCPERCFLGQCVSGAVTTTGGDLDADTDSDTDSDADMDADADTDTAGDFSGAK